MTCEVIDSGRAAFDSGVTGCPTRRRDDMTDARTIASRYIELWNERNPQRRRDILSANWSSDAKYVDPLMSGDGHDGIDALVAGVQQRFPDFRFKLISEPNGYGD